MKKHKTQNNFIFHIISILLLLFLFGCKEQTNTRNAQAAFFNTQLGVAYLKQNRLLLANEKFKKALLQAPDQSDVHHYYAILNKRLKRPKVAESHFKRALFLDKRNPELHNNYGTFLCEQKKYDLAEKEFVLAWKNPFYKTPEFAYTNAGVCMLAAGNKVKATHYFHQALKIKPNFTTALQATRNL